MHWVYGVNTLIGVAAIAIALLVLIRTDRAKTDQ
jgi:hypothetical protein